MNTNYYLEIFHEIKNSVALINSYLQLIEKKYPEVVGYNYWSTSRSETTRLGTIVKEFSQLKPGHELQLECLDLREFITDCCNGFQCYAEENNISCHLNLPQYPLMSFIDRQQLHYVFVNLFKNACEAMQPQGQIQIIAFHQLNRIIIQVKDSGCGIAPTLIDHIFHPFVTTKDTGSGLGLHIVHQIITAHNGTISVISSEGDGTTFTIELPYQDSNINM